MPRTLLLTLVVAVGAMSLTACDVFLSPDDRVERADQRIAAGDYRGAMIELKNALQDEPGHMHARLRLAEVALQLGDPVAAAKDLRRAIEAGAVPAQTAQLTAKVRLALGEFRELLAQIDSGELPLEEPARSLYRGQAFLGLQQFEPALQALRLAVAADPDSIAAQIGIAEALAGQGRSDDAVAELDRMAARYPGAEAWLVRGVIRAKRGEFEMAEQDLQEARKRAGSLTASQQLNLLTALAEVQLARGNSAEVTKTHAELAKLAPDAVATRVLAARIAMAAQDYPTAVAELQRSVAAAPDFVAARFLLGAALLAQGNLQQSELHLTQALQRAPENLEARKLLAQVRLRLGRSDAAMQVLLPVQQAEVADPQLDLLLGIAHLQHGEQATGIVHLERAAAAQPDNKNMQMDLAAAYLKAGQGDKAVELLSRMNRADADLRQASLLIAALSASKGERAAQQEVERLLSERPREVAVLNLAAAFYARERKFEPARALLQRAIEIEPGSIPILLARARVESAANELNAAVETLEKVVRLDADNTDAQMALAEIAVRRGDAKAAVAILENLRKRDPRAIDPRLRLAALYSRQRNKQGADAVASELATLGKDRPEVHNALGALYLEAGRYDEALLRFRAATELDKANPTYWLNVARAQISLGSNAAAREALEKSLSLQPDSIPVVGALAMLDLKDNNSAVSLARIDRLKQARPRDADVLTLEGDVMTAMRDFPRAVAAYDAALATKGNGAIAVKAYRARRLGSLPNPSQSLESWLAKQPHDTPVRVALAEAYQQAGDKRRAVQQYEEIARNGDSTAFILNNLAWLYHQLGDSRAEQTAKRAYDAAPGVAAIADTYGWILLQSGKPHEALPLLKQAAAVGKDPSIEYHYAVALAQSGAKEEARGRLVALLGRSADFDGAADAQRLLQSLSEAPASGR